MDNLNKTRLGVWVLLCLLSWFAAGGLAQEPCGLGHPCPDHQCCGPSWDCGYGVEYCCENKGCHSQCWDCKGCDHQGGLISADTFNQMLKHRNDDSCPAKGFYTFDAFNQAAKSFPDFANIGDTATRKRELAAFFAQTSHETNGRWATAPDSPYTWGYCFKQEQSPGSAYCASSSQYPCAPGKQYYGRGPIQISWNYNYGQCGTAIGVDLLNNPDLVASDPVISFKAALWFWMTAQSPKPSCHDVITGRWMPSNADTAVGCLPGYGTVTNIINGGLECGKGQDPRVASRIGFYKRYCEILGVGYGSNLDCYSQRPFDSGLLLESL